MTPHIILTLIFTSLAILSTQLEIVIDQTKHIQLEIGHVYSQQIPAFFQLYQAAAIKKFTRLQSQQQETTHTLICAIEDDEDSQYVQQSQYSHSHLADPSKYHLGLKKVLSFDDLFKLTGIVDIITVDQNKVIVLFQNGFYTSYQININDGKIVPQFVRHILHSDKMNINASQFGNRVYDRVVGFGDLLYDKSSNPEHIIFFGQEQALIMNKTTKLFQFLQGYQVIGQSYQKATLAGNKIFVGTGFQGVFVYEVDFQKKEITLKQKIRPYYKDTQGMQVYLQVSQLLYDPTTTQLILADPSQGIYWLSIPTNSSSTEIDLECLPNPILIQNCENMNYMMWDQQQQHQVNKEDNNAWTPVIVATCPQLLIVTLDVKRTHRVVDEISFYPQTVIANSSRVLLFGEYKYAVYDLQTNLVEQGQGERAIDFVTISKQHIVIVNMMFIYAGKIFAQTETITCAANNDNERDDVVGKYEFIMEIQGICSQLYTPQFISLINPNNNLLPTTFNLQQLPLHTALGPQSCFLKYNISLSINDTSKVNYLWQIIMGIIIAWILVGGMIVYCVKDIKIEKEYGKLIEENVNSSVDKSKDQEMEQPTNEQMFSQEQQKKQ